MVHLDVVIKVNVSKDGDLELPQQVVVHVDVRKEFTINMSLLYVNICLNEPAMRLLN